MYKTPADAAHFLEQFVPLVAESRHDTEIVLCVPFVDVHAVLGAKASDIGVGAQNLHWEKEGAYTGEVSAAMLVAAGCTHVLIGHSERRQYFGETDETVNRKLKAAL